MFGENIVSVQKIRKNSDRLINNINLKPEFNIVFNIILYPEMSTRSPAYWVIFFTVSPIPSTDAAEWFLWFPLREWDIEMVFLCQTFGIFPIYIRRNNFIFISDVFFTGDWPRYDGILYFLDAFQILMSDLSRQLQLLPIAYKFSCILVNVWFVVYSVITSFLRKIRS